MNTRSRTYVALAGIALAAAACQGDITTLQTQDDPALSGSGCTGAPSWVRVSPAAVTIPVGGTANLWVDVYDTWGCLLWNEPVSWYSTNPSVASVWGGMWSASVHGSAVGTAQVVAHAWNGASGSATVNVVTPPDPPVLTHILVHPQEMTLPVGSWNTFWATGRDQYGNTCSNWCGSPSPTWSVDDPSIASITTYSAEVNGLSVGRTHVRATSGTVSGSAGLDVVSQPVGCPPGPMPCPADPY
jgi:hypothetical protein